ncbi:DNA polymerase III subunit beta [Capnocytophaga canimorsus]|uniref:Beta sliding clamp n=2 Tax=Capnocytophaga canimorsus TaxID=28188 RepID=F9YTU8_CAPCC|nr:DNA polymerase III subunit beta [Capnocytophaga canimorsus]AEK22882.1 DNA polymerase III subunit beta [Capnocytophaga canimorsus Cc5]ATA77949.1 DNA polymerase III subunit beta [Capnocytophaga canimorsus]ATA92643.1 DNA polymerase III subunit beta [Capnocytophaga canimorsus]ATA94745.1 DNA polymerase III subunit beta [Capnocytophaga canimorsus]AYW36022.1 DNA polymerase III subunit beta [Capnocytophaga canimorsus]
MKFIVSSSLLLKKLQVIGGVINNSNTMPILDNFLFELTTNALTISASDLETTVRGVLEVESDSEGSIAVPAKLLVDILKTFAEQPLTFIVKDNNTIEISSTHGKYSLAYLNGEEFPSPVNLPEANKVSILGDVLATAIQKTIFAVGNDDLRPVMSGIFFEFSTEGLTFVGTDAHKLVKYHRSDIKANETSEFIMPKKPLNLLKGILAGSESEVTIEYNESNAKFSFDNMEFICRLIDGKYPNYDAVIPKENPNKLTINRTQFLSSARRVAIFSNKTTHQIRLKIAGADLQISAEDVDYSNKAEERLTCDYQGDDMEIGFNSRFLVEMLNNLDADEVMLEMSMPNRAGILTPIDGLDPGEKVLMLAMPIMLNNNI